MVWERVPKVLFVDSECIETAAYDAIANFNIAVTASVRILQELSIPAGERTVEDCARFDTR